MSHYMIELAQRVTYGADFLGTFYLHKAEDEHDRSVWQEAHCTITGATLQVSATETIRSTIRFVTTGPFKTNLGTPQFELLKEDLNFLLQEDDESEILLQATLD